MKYFKVIFTVALIFLICSAFSFPFFKKPSKTVYAFGVSASFKDTIVYFTEIQMLDSVKLGKDGFLPNRTGYSYELKSYMEDSVHHPSQTCMIFFDKNKKSLQDQEQNLRNLYKIDKSVSVQTIKNSGFKFIKPSDSGAVTVE
jgi:hypothetical protein